MSALTAAAEELLMAAFIEKKMLPPSKSKMDWVLIALSILLFGGGVFLAALGLDLFLEQKISPDMAAFTSAAVLFAISFLAMTATHHAPRRQQLQLEAPSDKIQKDLRTLIEGISTELEGPIQENPKTAVFLA